MAEEKTLMINDQPLYYRVMGNGRPVVLLHGFGEDGTVWEHSVNYLKDKCRLIIPDLPGSGRSALTSDVSMEGMAGAVKALLDALQIPACIMIGHSMGGYITLAFAEQYPARLLSFGLFHSTAYADTEEKKTTRRRGIEFIRDNGAAKFLEQAIPNLFSPDFKKQHPEIVQEICARYTNFPAASLVSYYEAMIERPDRTAVLKNFPRPVLFVMGTYDTAVPLEQGLQQCYLPQISYIHVLKHSAHMGMWEEPALSNSFLEEFILNSEIT